MKKLKAGVLGATGAVGQQFVAHLIEHPWFEIGALTGSARTAGRPYGEGVHWLLDGDVPEAVVDMIVRPTEPGLDVDIVFSALPTGEALDIEAAFAAAGYPVLTNASPYRMHGLVPLLIPEVNPDHSRLIPVQKETQDWKGFIVANANCSTTSIVLPLKVLQDAYGCEAAIVTTLQAVSGAGYPGVSSMDILGNVVPHIPNENKKLESEPRKILGSFVDGRIEMSRIKVSAQANRVPVIDGHMGSVSVKLGRRVEPEEVIDVFENWVGPEILQSLPTTPKPALIYRHEPDRPQPKRDRMAGNGLAWTVGQMRECPVFDVRFVCIAHNTLRGAASGSILNAELLVKQGYIPHPAVETAAVPVLGY